MIQPDFKAFTKAYKAGTPQLVWEKLASDLETPVSAFLKLKSLSRYRALLESVEPGKGHKNRYSFIALDPDQVWTSSGSSGSGASGNPLDDLRSFITQSAIDIPAGLPPMAASVIGYLGFDCVCHVENLKAFAPNPYDMEDALFFRPRISVVFDSFDDSLTIITPVRPSGGAARDSYAKARDRIEIVRKALAGPLKEQPAFPAQKVEFATNIEKGDFIGMLEKAREYILAGDIFQVVLSQRFQAPFAGDPFTFYRTLRRLNPSPFMFFLDLDNAVITGSSPEILVRCRNRKITIRPIAGTRPRGKTPLEDAALAKDLLADKKECAEHLMLLDLGRNDVGRVAKPGTIQVTEQNVVEYYSHVMHIVSNVEGKLRDDLSALDALLAGFPAGTVSGAPKVRALEIIHEIETDSRGVYAGAIGYFSAGGDMDTCIALRTAIIKDGIMHVQAGAGIVADSNPEAEWVECRHKAQALIAAAEMVSGKS